MTSPLRPIIEINELIALSDTALRIFEVSSGPNAVENFTKKHLSGAIHVDLNTQLSCIPDDFAKGGQTSFTQCFKFYTIAWRLWRN